jgi:hypothetical protein
MNTNPDLIDIDPDKLDFDEVLHFSMLPMNYILDILEKKY